MSKLFIGLLFSLAVTLHAGTFMIVVAELKPETPTALKTEVLRQTLIDAVFNELFDTGHIAFDMPPRTLNGWTPDWRMSHIEDAKRYGANKVVVIRLEWKAVDAETWDIAELNWAIIDANFKVEIGSGTLTPTFVRPQENELRGSQRIASEMMTGMKVGLNQ